MFMIGAFANGVKMLKELDMENLSDDHHSEAIWICNLVHSTTYKYTVGGMNQLLQNSEFGAIFSWFYEFYHSDSSECLIPSSLKTVAQKKALKAAIRKIYQNIDR